MPIVVIKLGVDEIPTKRFWRAVFAEFFGTLLFLTCVTACALRWGATSGSANNVEVGLGIGFAITTIAHIIGHISGGHLNPAVTLGMVVGGRTSILRGVFYVIAQLLGAMVGASIVFQSTPEKNRGMFGANILSPTVKTYQGFVLELMFTFILVLFVFSVTDPKKKVEPYAQTLGIGIAIWVAHVCLIPYTNCGINPARSLGPSVVTGIWDDHWIYWIAPLTGGLLASIVYNFILYVDDDDIDENRYDVKRQQSSVPLHAI